MKPLKHLAKQLPSETEFIKQQLAQNVPFRLALARYKEHKGLELWGNDVYLVQLHRNYRGEMNPDGPQRTMLTIRRKDGAPFGDWADLQEIKNQLLGEEAELVQLFPAESRRVDRVNLYWFYDNAGQRFPFGGQKRDVANG